MYQAVKLDNGVTILTESIPHVRSVVLGIWVNVGSRDESPAVAGVSHFIEHMMFKGTARRTAREIAEALDAVGGQLNAFTTKEYTCYYARVLDEHLDLAIDVLEDMLFHSRFAAEDIEREKNVIIEEIKMYEDAPDELVHDVFATTIWQGHSLGRPIIGTAEVIGRLTRQEILNYYRRHYCPQNMVVAVAGNIDPARVLEKLRAVFEPLQGEQADRRLVRPSPHRQVTCRVKDTEQVHLCVGTPGLPLSNERVYVFQVINTVLGGGISSRLFQEIREQRGLVYSVYSYHSSYHDAGLFCIYAGLSRQNVPAVLELISREIRDIRENGLKPAELKRAKDQLIGNLWLSLESVTTRMSRLAKSQLYLGEVVPPEEVVARIERITAEDVQGLAQEMLRPECFAAATVGPWDDRSILEAFCA
ncbi:M16 family metallopeptidase [Desulfovirgula thermocuniculi]|uniref:M16 family metallopeptidase n=1 Tax=Desulfovirgula thermocuniculi TaxID=348842 RepID=UPI000412047A|nr:pitrilysin family protein [Desulfovirgula thermocuniculi]